MQTEHKISVEQETEKQDYSLSMHKNKKIYKLESTKWQL